MVLGIAAGAIVFLCVWVFMGTGRGFKSRSALDVILKKQDRGKEQKVAFFAFLWNDAQCASVAGALEVVFPVKLRA